jgi:hypothetical protein
MSFCEVVGSSGQLTGAAISYHGRTWGPATLPDPGHGLSSVSCVSSSSCRAVDQSGQSLSFDGRSWSTPSAIDGTNALRSVSCVSSIWCLATDALGNAIVMG